eukprot:CAMPEP_0197234044 /NCGR_PEP_ID=MMETSP1429-20130617/1897_1 /TAXON_ID=49237 /ORGANISM="Chaetoceros  sp., Strain UNC1202" /LENGTH=138 /DNA_ID=CAMNT_0042692369 /DNA_START=254 /DNA_END=670 /DNA_ORIENTATION=-
MAGGRGWGNDDFLSSLGGSEEERGDEREKYEEFKDGRESFEKRQMERMNSPAGRQYMKAMNEKQLPRSENLEDDGGFFADVGFGSSALPNEGNSRFEHMMNQAAAQKNGRPGMIMGPGMFEQKLAIPLDDDETETDGE